MIEQYNKIKKLKNFNLNSEPIPFKSNITNNDIKRGYITRYFVQKTNDDQKLDEGALSAAVIAHLIVGGLLALPLVIKYIGEAFQYLGKGINFASRIFTGKSKPATDDLQQKIQKGEATTGDLVTAMGKILEDHTAHWLHKKYLNFFTKVFGGAAGLLYFYKTGKKMDKTTKETIGKVFFYALVIYLCIAALKAGISGFTEHYGPTIITNSELISLYFSISL